MEVNFDRDHYIFPIFTVLKQNTKEHIGMIMNLKELNNFIIPHHFKMDTFEMAIKIGKAKLF